MAFKSPSMQSSTVRFVSGHYKNSRERQDARTYIRTHAANVSRWRHWMKLVDAHEARDLAQQSPAQVFTSAESHELSISTSAIRRTNSVVLSSGNPVDGREEYENWTQNLLFTLSIEQFFDTLNIPIQLPVEALSVLPREVTLNALQQLYCMVEQTWLPCKHDGINEAAISLMNLVVADVGLLHGLMLAQLIRNKAAQLQQTDKTDFYLLACSAQVVKYINNRLGDVQTACDDYTMLAVLCMAYSGKIYQTKALETGPTQGPLETLDFLNLYGSIIDTDRTHEQGLARMIQVRGGLGSIKLPGLAAMLSYADIIYSSRRLTKPRLPFQPAFNDDYDTQLQSLRRIDRRLCSLGKGFSVLGNVLPKANLKNLRIALERLSLYTLGVEDYITGSFFSQSLSVLADQRKFCQHGLLSLIPRPGTGREHDLIHACRTAATIYSFLCVYPIPAAPFVELATGIKQSLSTQVFANTWREVSELAAWIVVMGGIAATGTELRTWFVSVLDRCLNRLRCDSWDALKAILEQFLWLGSTNDYDGLDLWNEVEESNPFKTGGTPGDGSSLS